ncbi:MAG: Ig-like domain-containing protein, partial [Rudanella sp.]|nr:Ig-like domain-containing protein [Rudanella sp.]
AFTDTAERVRAKLKKQQGLPYDLVKHGTNWQGNLVTPAEKWHVAHSPTITITAPSATAETNGSFTIKTNVSGQTSRVEFFINSMLVGIDSTAPYTANVTQLAPGAYTLFARVFDRKNEHTSSAPVIITILPK